MNMERSKRTMRRLGEKSEVSVEDVLNILYDVCQDVREGCGSPVEKLPCQDEGELYRRLPWMTRTVLRICRQNENLISDAHRQEHIRELSDEVENYSRQIENGAQEITQLLERKKAAQDAAFVKKEELNAVLEETKKAEAQTRQLQDEIEEARTRLAEEKEQREYELSSREEEMRALESERARSKLLLEGEEAQKAVLESDALRSEILELTQRTERLQELRKKLTAESALFGVEDRDTDSAGAPDIGQAFERGLEQVKKQLTDYSRTLRSYADMLSDVGEKP